MTTLTKAAREALDALNAMLTHMGMDEDEWNKPTFNQARAALAALRAALSEAPGEEREGINSEWNACMFRDTCRAMLAARPEAPTVAQKPLTRAQISRASGDAQIAFCLNKQPTYQVAFAREVERLHGIGKEGGA